MVEPFHQEKNQYGTALEREQMSFADYITALQQDHQDRQRYLTTQYEGLDGEKALPPPCDALASDYPLVPRVMCANLPRVPFDAARADFWILFLTSHAHRGKLTLQQVNLWLGRSPAEGSSSGLHHDFADNLYILLAGTKRFTLFPPAAAEHLMTNGQLDVVHDNGLM